MPVPRPHSLEPHPSPDMLAEQRLPEFSVPVHLGARAARAHAVASATEVVPDPIVALGGKVSSRAVEASEVTAVAGLPQRQRISYG